MGILTEDMKRVVSEQRLGFVATVCPDGTPNLSPKGTTAVWDDDHIVFADIRSPATVAIRVVGVLIASDDLVEALTEQRQHGMTYTFLFARITDAFCQPVSKTITLIKSPQR